MNLESYLPLIIPIINTLCNSYNASRQRSTIVSLEERRQIVHLKQEYLRISNQQEQEKDRQAFQEKLAKLGHEKSLEIQKFIQSVNYEINEKNLNFQSWRIEQEKILQLELVTFNRETQLQLAAYQRETTLHLPEIQKKLEYWPLKILPSTILNSHPNNQVIPLRIFISPPDIKFDKFSNSVQASSFPKIESILTQELKDFLNTNYPLTSQIRPTEYLDGAWDSNRFYGNSAIKVLFEMLKSEPTLILFSDLDGEYISFHIAYWRLGNIESQLYYSDTIISRLRYTDILIESAKSRAIKWTEETKEILLTEGYSQEQVNQWGVDNDINFKNLKEEEKLKHKGVDTDTKEFRSYFPYKINNKDIEVLCQFLVNCHCLMTGLLADIHHLFHNDIPPLMPELLPKLTQGDVNSQIIPVIVSAYQQIYKSLEEERSNWVPELSLQLAQSLTHLPEKSWAKDQINRSLRVWLKQRQVSEFEGIEVVVIPKLLEAMKLAVTKMDIKYLEKLKKCFISLGDDNAVDQVQELIKDTQNHKTETINIGDVEYLERSQEYFMSFRDDNAVDQVQEPFIKTEAITVSEDRRFETKNTNKKGHKMHQKFREEINEIKSDLVDLEELLQKFIYPIMDKVTPEALKKWQDVIYDTNEVLKRLESGYVWIALCGMTGVGKSAIINSLIGENSAEVNIKNDSTKSAEIYYRDSDLLAIVDTPGFLSEKNNQETAIRELESRPPHIYIFVIQGEPIETELEFFNSIHNRSLKIPKIVFVNKWDSISSQKPSQEVNIIRNEILEKMKKFVESPESIIYGSALLFDREHDQMIRQELPNLLKQIYKEVLAFGIFTNVIDPAISSNSLNELIRERAFEVRYAIAKQLINACGWVTACSGPIPFDEILLTPGLYSSMVHFISKIMGKKTEKKSEQIAIHIAFACAKTLPLFNMVTIGATSIDIFTTAVSIPTAGVGGVLGGWFFDGLGFGYLKYYRTAIFGEVVIEYIRNGFSWGMEGETKVIKRCHTRVAAEIGGSIPLLQK